MTATDNFGPCFQVLREFKRPADVTEKEIDAAGDGTDHIFFL